jgi:hypothetical protein
LPFGEWKPGREDNTLWISATCNTIDANETRVSLACTHEAYDLVASIENGSVLESLIEFEPSIPAKLVNIIASGVLMANELAADRHIKALPFEQLEDTNDRDTVF